MDKPVRVFASRGAVSCGPPFCVFSVGLSDDNTEYLVVPIDDASLAAMVERAVEARYGATWLTRSAAWRVCERAEMGSALRAALGINGD